MPTIKEIRATVRPNRVPRLREALRAIPGFPGVTLYRAQGFSAPSATPARRSVRDELADFSTKVMLSVVADETLVPAIREAIFASCRTGELGDGVVWVLDVDDARRIRDGEAVGAA